MKVARKLLITGGASLVLAGGIIALPLSSAANAKGQTLESMTKPMKSFSLKEESNEFFNVQTEVDPGSHILWVKVTNKSDNAMVPKLTFNGEVPPYNSDLPLKPGETREFAHYFSGNNFTVLVAVAADGAKTLTVPVMVNLQEPVTFQATESNESVIIGQLRNNSTLVPQTVYTKSYNDAMQVEQLEPGEERTVAIPHSASENQKVTTVVVANSAGYESNYTVELDLVPELPGPMH